MRTALLALTVAAALGLLAGAVLAGLALAGAPDAAPAAATLVVRLAVIPALLAAILAHRRPAPRRAPRRSGPAAAAGPGGADDDGEAWARILAAAPAWLRLLHRALFAWVLIDFARIALAALTGWPPATEEAPGEAGPWSIWLFLWAVCLSLAVVALRRTARDDAGRRPG